MGMWNDIKEGFKVKAYIKKVMKQLDDGETTKLAAKRDMNDKISKCGAGSRARFKMQQQVEVELTRYEMYR